MIYYIVESNEQASTMERALRSDVIYSEMNGARHDFGRVIYLNPRTPMEEANVAALLNDVWPPHLTGATSSRSSTCETSDSALARCCGVERVRIKAMPNLRRVHSC